MRRELVYLLLGGLVLVVVLTGAARADLVGWWKFNEDSGTVAVDSSGNGNDGVLEGGTQRVAGQHGDGIQFNGSNSLVRAPYIPLNRRSFTVAMWINPVLYTGEQVVFSQRQRSAVNTDLHFRLGGPGGGDAPAGGVRMGFYGNDLDTRGGIIQDNNWYHITFRYDFENQDRRIYINGTQEAQGTATAYLGTSGNTVIGSWAGESQWFRGIIDDVRIYSHVLTDAEIQSVMSGLEGYPYASNPNPTDGALHPDTWVTLSWKGGDFGVSHDVYLGDNFDDVNAGTGDTFLGNQTNTSYFAGLSGYAYPDGLVPGTMYYWRIDEVENDGVTKHRGDIWSFFVPSGKAYNPDPANGAESVAADVTLRWTVGRGAGKHTVYFSDDPETVENAVEGPPQIVSRFYPGDLEFDKTYYWRVDEFDGAATHKGDVWSFTTMPADVSSAATYYVSPYERVASDNNPGTEARPFKTIGKATPLLRPGDTLLIRAGIYRETVILSQSGTATKPIKIMAYPGDEGKVIINAAEPVRNWQKCAGPDDCTGNPNWNNIYYADVQGLVESHPDSDFAIRQVFQNGKLLNRSRYPDTGWSYPTGIPDSRRTFSDSSLSKPTGYFDGSVCHIKTQVWQINQIDIADYSGDTITLSESPRYDISTRFGYYITNVVGEINKEGEWAYDPASKRLFIWPEDEIIFIEITYRKFCLRTYGGVSWNEVRGLGLHNAYAYGIWLCRASDVRIEDNTVEHSYEHGIYVEGWGGRC
ncbi:LamG-like jellyroll fold domain-containing protein, partial [Planctomycetota bacterium]